MKAFALTALAALSALSLAAPAGAAVQQSRWGDSDDFNCNHGDPAAQRTVEACARLRNTSLDPGEDPAPVRVDAGWSPDPAVYGQPLLPGAVSGCRHDVRPVMVVDGPGGRTGHVRLLSMGCAR